MMGTSLLSMPWAMESAGAIPAVVLLTVVAGISFYTAYRVLEVFENNGEFLQINLLTDIHKLILKKLIHLINFFN